MLFIDRPAVRAVARRAEAHAAHADAGDVQILSLIHILCATCGRSGNCSLQKIANDLGIITTEYARNVPANSWPQDYPLVRDASKCIKLSLIKIYTDLAIACAQAGKHMLIEKPLATMREDVFAILEAVQKAGVRAMVDLHNRWNPPFNLVRQMVESGEYGAPKTAYFRLNDALWVATDMLSWTAKSSILWFLGSHSLDTLSWIVGSRPAEVDVYKRQRYDCLKLGVTWDRATLRSRIDERLKRRLDQGMVDEVRRLMEDGATPEFLMKLGLEYRFIARYLMGEAGGYQQMVDGLATAIKQFAKRQTTWFRRDPEILWLDMAGDPVAQACAAIDRFLQGR